MLPIVGKTFYGIPPLHSINIPRIELEKKYWLSLENLLPNSNVHLHNMYKLGTIHKVHYKSRGLEKSKLCQNMWTHS